MPIWNGFDKSVQDDEMYNLLVHHLNIYFGRTLGPVRTIFLGQRTEPEPETSFAFRGRVDERLDNARAVCDKRFLYIRNYMPYVPWMQRLPVYGL